MNEHQITADQETMAIIGLATNEHTKYAMRGIRVDGHGFTATDGKVLGRVSHNGAEVPGISPFTIDLDDSKAAQKAIGRGKNERPFDIHYAESDDVVHATRDGVSMSLKPMEGHYPDVEMVMRDIPGGHDDGIRTGVYLDATLLLKVVKAAVAFGGKNAALLVTIKDGNRDHAVRFDLDSPQGTGRKFTAVQMPLNATKMEGGKA